MTEEILGHVSYRVGLQRERERVWGVSDSDGAMEGRVERQGVKD